MKLINILSASLIAGIFTISFPAFAEVEHKLTATGTCTDGCPTEQVGLPGAIELLVTDGYALGALLEPQHIHSFSFSIGGFENNHALWYGGPGNTTTQNITFLSGSFDGTEDGTAGSGRDIRLNFTTENDATTNTFFGTDAVINPSGFNGYVAFNPEFPLVLEQNWLYEAVPAAVPIPAALPLFLSGLAGLGIVARRKKQAV